MLARQVTHTNVIRIHDLGEIDGIKYITMPFVPGTDLARLLKQEGKLPPMRALAIARQIASGLRAAHEVGVVHRDLKPANILIDEEDKAIITDFGIARSTESGTIATAAGAIVGTLAYMAPEQAMGKPVDQRADIYAFGLIVSEMLVSRRAPSQGDTALALLIERCQPGAAAASHDRPVDSGRHRRDRRALSGARTRGALSDDAGARSRARTARRRGTRARAGHRDDAAGRGHAGIGAAAVVETAAHGRRGGVVAVLAGGAWFLHEAEPRSSGSRR